MEDCERIQQWYTNPKQPKKLPNQVHLVDFFNFQTLGTRWAPLFTIKYCWSNNFGAQRWFRKILKTITKNTQYIKLVQQWCQLYLIIASFMISKNQFDYTLFLLISVLWDSASGKATEEPYFSRSPKDVSVVVGSSVTLPCEVTPDDGVIYYWELNGK